MSMLIEWLESRALLSGTVSADGAKLVADLTAARTDLRAAVTLYHADTATLAADLKALPKSKTNTADLAKLKSAQASALASESKDASRLLATVQNQAKQGVADYFAYEQDPTAANSKKLGLLITATMRSIAPTVSKLTTDLGTSGTKIDADLNALAGANPGDPTLAADVQHAEADQASVTTKLTADISAVQQDVSIFADDLQSIT